MLEYRTVLDVDEPRLHCFCKGIRAWKYRKIEGRVGSNVCNRDIIWEARVGNQTSVVRLVPESTKHLPFLVVEVPSIEVAYSRWDSDNDFLSFDELLSRGGLDYNIRGAVRIAAALN